MTCSSTLYWCFGHWQRMVTHSSTLYWCFGVVCYNFFPLTSSSQLPRKNTLRNLFFFQFFGQNSTNIRDFWYNLQEIIKYALHWKTYTLKSHILSRFQNPQKLGFEFLDLFLGFWFEFLVLLHQKHNFNKVCALKLHILVEF